jgi:hypothetical protein
MSAILSSVFMPYLRADIVGSMRSANLSNSKSFNSALPIPLMSFSPLYSNESNDSKSTEPPVFPFFIGMLEFRVNLLLTGTAATDAAPPSFFAWNASLRAFFSASLYPATLSFFAIPSNSFLSRGVLSVLSLSLATSSSLLAYSNSLTFLGSSIIIVLMYFLVKSLNLGMFCNKSSH